MPRNPSAVAEKPTDSPSVEHQRLQAFIGSWQTDGCTIEDGEPKASIHSNDVYEWLPGGYFVAHRWHSQIGGAEVHGLEVIGYDRQAQTYRTQFFDNQGHAGSETLTVDGRTWRWIGHQVMGTPWHRCTSTVSEDGRMMNARHERSDDGKNWTPWMEITLRRDD